jgi:hypothetical protein
LRQAIADANTAPEADTISFAITGTITLAAPLPTISDDMTIAGPGTNLLTISGNNSVRIFSVSAGTNSAMISGLTIANGRVTGYANGAGISNDGTLTVLDCAFVGNQAFGGWGGAIFNAGYLSVFNTTFSGNQVVGEKGSDMNGNTIHGGGGGAGMGGALFTLLGSVNLQGCLFSSNSAAGGNGGGNSGVGPGNGRGGGVNGGAGCLVDTIANGQPGGFGGGGGGGYYSMNGGAGGYGGGGGGCQPGPGGIALGGFGGGAGGQGGGGSAGSGGGGAGLGGGVFVHSGTVTIGNCVFVANQVIKGLGGTGNAINDGMGIGQDVHNMAGTILPVLSATTSGGGTVTVNPTNPPYLNNSLATVTATPALGWKLLYWLGDASGTNQTQNLTVSRNKYVEAVFGTELTVSALISSSSQADYFPYGTIVKLTALPPMGTYFASWSGAASGSSNPLKHNITNANQTISCLFSPLNAGQFALAVIENGRGFVSASPSGNFHTNGQLVTLTPTPDAGQNFVGWSGDASGTNSPIVVTMNQSKIITANFTKRPSLRVSTPLEGLVEDGFRLTVLGEFGTPYTILGSTNLLRDWQVVGAVTNTYGTVQFVDPDGTDSQQKFYRATEP